MRRTRTAQEIDVFLRPGDHFVGNDHYRVSTVLGSCVSITLWQPRRHLGAMSHFLLPNRHSEPGAVPDGRYADEVMLILKEELMSMGVKLSECVGKIFGGGNMFPGQPHADARNIGKKNGEAARALLHGYHIPIVSEYLFGVGHRQVVFDIGSGSVWSRQMPVFEQGRLPSVACP